MIWQKSILKMHSRPGLSTTHALRVRVHAQATRLVASAAVSSTRRFDGDAVMSELITSSSCARARQANWLLDMSAMLLWSRS